MTPTRIFFATATLGLAISLLVGMLGFIVGGLFLVAMVPLFGRGRWAAVAGCLVGFGAGWTTLVLVQLDRGGSSGNDALWLGIGVVPLAIGLAITTAVAVLATTRPGDRGGDAVP
jgi:hypothetical protein